MLLSRFTAASKADRAAVRATPAPQPRAAALPHALAPRTRRAASFRRQPPRAAAGEPPSASGGNEPAPGPPSRRGRPAASPTYQKLVTALLKLKPLDNAFHRSRLSPEVLEAMERTTAGMLGQLPGEFKLRVECEREALHKLLHSAVLTGCMLHNVEARWQLVRGLEAALPEDEAPPPSALPDLPALPAEALAEASPEVAAYAAALKARLDAAEASLATAAAAAERAASASAVTPPGTNALLSHLRALQASQVAALSPAGSVELSSACAALVESLLGRLPASRAGGPHRKAAPPPLPGLADGDEEEAADARPLADMAATLSFSREYARDLLLWAMGAGHFARAQDHLCRLERSVLGSPARDDASFRPFLDGAASPTRPEQL